MKWILHRCIFFLLKTYVSYAHLKFMYIMYITLQSLTNKLKMNYLKNHFAKYSNGHKLVNILSHQKTVN